MYTFLVLLTLFKAIKIIKITSSYSNFKETTKNLFLLLLFSIVKFLSFYTKKILYNRLCPWSTFLEKYYGWFNQGVIKKNHN